MKYNKNLKSLMEACPPSKIIKCSIFTFLLLSNFAAYTQLATIDSRILLAQFSIFSKIDSIVEIEGLKYATDYNKKLDLAKSLANKVDSLSRLIPLAKSSTNLNTIQERANTAKNEFLAYEKSVQQKLEEYRMQTLLPYYTKINTAIKAVAIRLKYKQVMDIQSVNFAYIDINNDITEEVSKHLLKDHSLK